MSGLNTGRFLDPPEFVVMHDKGNEENVFDRVDYQLTTSGFASPEPGIYALVVPDAELLRRPECATPWNGVVVDNGGLGPNGLARGPDGPALADPDLQHCADLDALINSNTVLTLGAFVRHDQYNYYPSANPFADLGPPSFNGKPSPSSGLTNAGARASVSYVKGINNIKAGIRYEQTFLTENDHLGIVDPTLNAPCLTLHIQHTIRHPGTGFTDPSQCAGARIAAE